MTVRAHASPSPCGSSIGFPPRSRETGCERCDSSACSRSASCFADTTRALELFFERHPVDRLYVVAVGVFLQAQLIEPLLYAKLLERDMLLLHAAGVSAGGTATLFPAHGGTGKTTLSLRLARGGFALLGDDLILVDVARGLAHAHPRPLHLFSYNLRQFRDVRIPLSLRLVIRFKDILRTVLEAVLREEFLISTRAHAERILPDLRWAQAPTPVGSILFLSTRAVPRMFTSAKADEVDAAAALIAESGDLVRSLGEHFLSVSEQEAFATHEREVIRRLLRGLSGLRVINPRALSADDLSRLIERGAP